MRAATSVTVGLALAGFAVMASPWPAEAAPPPPVYVHMNGANMFLEGVVAVRPGQRVVFVNEDTGAHTVVGYNPNTGKTSTRFAGALPGTKGPQEKPSTYGISFKATGLHYYYCSVHAMLMMEKPESVTTAKVRPGVGGFGDPMEGLIIVTTDPKLLAANPTSSRHEVIANYFGG